MEYIIEIQGCVLIFKKEKENNKTKMEMPKMRKKKERKCKFIKYFAKGQSQTISFFSTYLNLK